MKMTKRCDEHPVTAYYHYHSIGEFKRSRRLEGPIRVIVFCIISILLPFIFLIIPLYLRYEHYKDVNYNLGESDLITVDRPISTLFCSGQDLWMNGTFHAYLLNEQPKISEDLKQIEMKKHMQLADDSLEYWGFFLLQGSKVTLSVCSKYDGARLMVVKGSKNLKHCALLDPDKPGQIDPWEEDVSAPQGEKIEVTFQQGDKEMIEVLQTPSSSTVQNQTVTKKSSFPKRYFRANTTEARVKVDVFLPPKSEKIDKENSTKNSSLGPSLMSEMGLKKDKMSGENETRPSMAPTSDIQTMHEKNKVVRHKTRLPSSGGKSNKTRRFIVSDEKEPIDGDVEYSDKSEYKIEEDEDLDLEEAPNPVGNMPEKLTVKNRAEKELGNDVDGDEEEIEKNIRSSGSSFAKNLWSCYGGDTLFMQSFQSSTKCQSQDSMMKSAIRMKSVHEVTSTGYYYYIFYSDNDIVSNDIFARFNIEKVEYSFPNYTNSCRNATSCSLPFEFFSSEKVLVEVPIQDGLSDEDALAQMILISTCRPRLLIYLIFPIALLISILSSAFI